MFLPFQLNDVELECVGFFNYDRSPMYMFMYANNLASYIPTIHTGYISILCMPTPTLAVQESFSLRLLLWFLWGVCPCVSSLRVEYMHVFLGRSHKNMNNVCRLASPVLNRYTYLFKVTVFM